MGRGILMRKSDEEKGVRVGVCVPARGKAHMTIIGLIMNTISPRTYATVADTHTHTHTPSAFLDVGQCSRMNRVGARIRKSRCGPVDNI